jgi:molybdopterin-guanine dinucleotide biosynthesis protein A
MDTALILAGGESSRFGEPKALVDVGEKPMVSRVFDAIAPVADEVVISVANSQMADMITGLLSRAQVAIDRRHGIGPIEGIVRGFEIARGERVLVAPCDAPLLRPELYRLLLEALGEYEAAVPKLEAADPVRAVYRRAPALAVLTTSRGIRSPSALVDHLRCQFVGEDRIRAVDPNLLSFWDVNSQSDLDNVGPIVESRNRSATSD